MNARNAIGVLMAVAGMCVWLAGTSAPVAAHHAFAAEFDADRPVEFSGTVTEVEWVNPHVWIHKQHGAVDRGRHRRRYTR